MTVTAVERGAAEGCANVEGRQTYEQPFLSGQYLGEHVLCANVPISGKGFKSQQHLLPPTLI